jgi:hypothetical protein
VDYATLLQHFGSQVAIAKALSIKQASVARWARTGRVPILRQFQVESLTKRRLKAGPICG